MIVFTTMFNGANLLQMKVIASDGTIFVHRRDMLKKFCQVFFNVIEGVLCYPPPGF